MFRKKDEKAPLIFSDCHGGKGDVTAREMYSRGDLPCGFQFFQDTTVPVGASIGLHRHHGNCEIYYMLEGEALMNDDGNEIMMYPGDISVVLPEHTHSLINTGSVPVRIIVVEAGDETEAENL